MGKIISIIIAAYISVPAAGMAQAGQPETILDSLIATAINKNPELIAAENQYQAMLSGYRATGWLPDPNISLMLMNVPYDTWALDESPMSALALGISQKIPWPGKLAAQRSAARLSASAGQLMSRAMKNSVVRRLKSAYFDYSYLTLTEKIIDENIALLTAIAEVAQTRYANGEGVAADVLKAQTEWSMMQDRRLDIENMRKQARSEINSLIDRSPFDEDDYPAYLPEITLLSQGPGQILTEAITGNPSLAISQTHVQIAEKQRSLAKSDYWPELMLGFEYQIREPALMNNDTGQDLISAKIELSVPLWFRKNQNNNLREASSRLEAARHMLDSDKRDLENRIAAEIWELSRLQSSSELFNNAILPQAEATLESADIAYRVGKLDFLDLLSAQQRLLDIQVENLKIKRDYNIKLAVLDELVGTDNWR